MKTIQVTKLLLEKIIFKSEQEKVKTTSQDSMKKTELCKNIICISSYVICLSVFHENAL